MMHKRIIVVVYFALATLGLFLLFLGGWVPRVPSQGMSVAFIGLTNLPSKGPYAVLSLTNLSNLASGLLVDSFEESSSGTWARHGLTNGTGLTSQAHTWLNGFMGWKDSLSPGQTALVYVPVPNSVSRKIAGESSGARLLHAPPSFPPI